MKINWLRISLGVLAILAVSYVGLAHAQTKTPGAPGQGAAPVSTTGLGGLMPGILAGPLLFTWGKTSVYDDNTAIPSTVAVTYNVYESLNGAAETLIGGGLTLTSAAVNSFPLAAPHCITITAVAAGVESVHTTAVCATPPALMVKATDTNAYKRRESLGGYTWVVFGTVTVGTVCDATHQDDGYQIIPRAFVTLANKFDTFPLVSWAHCQ
jgi:hypothetical protein